jgi:hypothetical protein
MKGLENQEYLVGYLAFNILAVFFLFAAVKWSRVARLLFFFLFAWACVMNWTFSQNDPTAYQEYADLTFSPIYKGFITGWFKSNTVWIVGTIAICQGLIAISMLLKGWIFRIGNIGAIIFLLSIAPLGVGSGFPCTIFFALAMFMLFNKGQSFLWRSYKKAKNEFYERHHHLPG